VFVCVCVCVCVVVCVWLCVWFAYMHVFLRACMADAKGEGPPVRPIETLAKVHNQECVSVLQSPHFPDICMTVGDWTFSLWKEGCDEPLFTSSCADAYLTCAAWSPSRPGVIIMGKSNGVLDIWILIDQIHKPVRLHISRLSRQLREMNQPQDSC